MESIGVAVDAAVGGCNRNADSRSGDLGTKAGQLEWTLLMAGDCSETELLWVDDTKRCRLSGCGCNLAGSLAAVLTLSARPTARLPKACAFINCY